MATKRKALCVGINTFKNYPSATLQGCVNDANDMSGLLKDLYGFADSDIDKLSDEQATKANIMSKLESMVSDAKAGKYDCLVFSMSTHGTQVPEVSSPEEPDLADEAFCPYDLAQKDNQWDPEYIIVDDELHDLFVQLPENVQLEVFLDTCHSGTGLKAVDMLLNRKPRYLPPPSLMAFNKIDGLQSRGLLQLVAEKKITNHILWAGCRADQTSADARIGDDWHGAFTYYFCKEMRDCNNQLPRSQILEKVRADLKKEEYTQTPQLEGEATVRTQPKKWTILVYLAGDNNLDTEGVKDLAEMAKVGSNNDINVIAQFDRAGTKGTQRFYITKGGGYTRDSIMNLGETNCGDPEILIDFLKWGISTYPAEHYMAVLWNHGSGWKEDDIYNRALKLSPERTDISPFEIRKISRAGGRTGIKRSLFNTTVDNIVKLEERQRAIAYDDGSKDFLDNKELKNALSSALQQSSVDKFDIIGFDACLMNMLEVGYQIKDSAKIAVGSEETEPGEGWPYDRILDALANNPDMKPAEFANTIVEEYAKSYDIGAESPSVTQSAVNLEEVNTVRERLDSLAATLTDKINSHFWAITRSHFYTQHFSDAQYIDLDHFAELMAKEAVNEHDRWLHSLAQQLRKTLGPGWGLDGYILSSKNLGKDMENSRGVSIYFPGKSMYSNFYNDIDMSREGKWDEFIKAYQEEYDKGQRNI